MLKTILGEESLNELCAIFLQKITHRDQTLLQGLDLVPFDNIEPGIINVPFVYSTEIRIQPMEVIDPRRF